MTVHLDLWRNEHHRLTEGTWRTWTLEAWDGPSPELPEGKVVPADVVVDAGQDRLVWYHRNEHSMWALSLRLQGFGDYLDRFADPLLRLTFGGAVTGPGLRRVDDRTLRSDQPATHHEVRVVAQVAQTGMADEWLERLAASVAQDARRPAPAAFDANRACGTISGSAATSSSTATT